MTIASDELITAADKNMRIEKIAELLRTVKQARQRANDTDAIDFSVANQIFNYINAGPDVTEVPF